MRRRRSVASVWFPPHLGNYLRAPFLDYAPPARHRWFGSGASALRAALTMIVERATSGERSIVCPDFICSSVPAAIRAAGAEPMYCRVDPSTWFYRREELGRVLEQRPLAVIVVSYFGLAPAALSEIDQILAELAGQPIVFDGAQAFSRDLAAAAWPASTYRVFSFGRGKSLPVWSGGLLTAEGNAELPPMPAAAQHTFGNIESVGRLLASALQSLLLSPGISPFVPLPSNIESPETTFSCYPLAWPARGFVYASFPALDVEIRARIENARCYGRLLASNSRLLLPRAATIDTGVSLRFPIVFETAEAAERCQAALSESGLLQGPNRWTDYARSTKTGAAMARRLITLPTHSGASALVSDLANIVANAC